MFALALALLATVVLPFVALVEPPALELRPVVVCVAPLELLAAAAVPPVVVLAAAPVVAAAPVSIVPVEVTVDVGSWPLWAL